MNKNNFNDYAQFLKKGSYVTKASTSTVPKDKRGPLKSNTNKAVVPNYGTLSPLIVTRPKILSNSNQTVVSVPSRTKKIKNSTVRSVTRTPTAVVPNYSDLSQWINVPQEVTSTAPSKPRSTSVAKGTGPLMPATEKAVVPNYSDLSQWINVPQGSSVDDTDIILKPDSVHVVPVDSIPSSATDTVAVTAPAVGAIPDSVVVQPVQSIRPMSVSTSVQTPVKARAVQLQQETKSTQTKSSKRRPIQRNPQQVDVSYDIDSLVRSEVIPTQSDQVVVSNTPAGTVSIPVVESSNVYNNIPETTIRQIEDSVQRNVISKKPIVLIKKNKPVPINLQDYNGYVDIPTETSTYAEPIPAEVAYNVRTNYVEDQRLRKEYLKQEIANIARTLNEQL